MGLADELNAILPNDPGPPCGIAVTLDLMSPEDQSDLNEALFARPRRLSNSKMQMFLITKGYDVSFSSVTLHRRRECKCFVGKSNRMRVTTHG